jgi:hypothetical protein
MPLMRNLGEFVGHIIKGLKTRPDEPRRTVVRRHVEEEDRGDVVLRRTTVEEVELRGEGTKARASADKLRHEGTKDPKDDPNTEN